MSTPPKGATLLLVVARKTCTRCKESKAFADFPVERKNSCGHCPMCIPCRQAYRRAFQQRPDNQDRYRRMMLDKNFGMSVEEYDVILERQGGTCAICNQVCRSGRRLAVDHDHKTGLVRGLLCLMCNTGIGKFDDDAEALERAAAYLRGMAS